MHLLVVEDDARLARMLKRLLSEDRHVVEVAGTGRGGLELAEGMSGLDAIVLDIGLPDLNGLELARRIRSGGSAGARNTSPPPRRAADLDLPSLAGRGRGWVRETRLAEVRE